MRHEAEREEDEKKLKQKREISKSQIEFVDDLIYEASRSFLKNFCGFFCGVREREKMFWKLQRALTRRKFKGQMPDYANPVRMKKKVAKN